MVGIKPRQLARMRQKITNNLLPQIMTVYRSDRQTVDTLWDNTYDAAPVGYTGDFANLDPTLIPCRLDPTRLYRTEDVFDQEKIVNEYQLWFPYDFNLNPDERVHIEGKVYEVRKIMENHGWRSINSAQVVVVEP